MFLRSRTHAHQIPDLARPHTMAPPAWFVQPEDVEAYELVRDNTSSFSWKRARGMNLACDRHPFTGRDGPQRQFGKRVICHMFQEEARSPNDAGGWIWTKKR